MNKKLSTKMRLIPGSLLAATLVSPVVLASDATVPV